MSEHRAESNGELAPKLADMRDKLAALRVAKHRQLKRDFHRIAAVFRGE
jgi:ribosomal protein L29